ncbi:MAG TPA: hypothetical protein VGP82_03410, partial [Ktedonobacterales bacterium]|nr:hypothetical protein [Ktedonobacterales bacterium]
DDQSYLTLAAPGPPMKPTIRKIRARGPPRLHSAQMRDGLSAACLLQVLAGHSTLSRTSAGSWLTV